MKKINVVSYSDKQIISNVYINTPSTKVGGLDIQDPRIERISLLEVEGLPENCHMTIFR